MNKNALVAFIVTTVGLGACSEDTINSGATAQTKMPRATERRSPRRAAPAISASTLVGKKAPSFTLTDLDGEKISLSDYTGKRVVLEWFSPECSVTNFGYRSNLQESAKNRGNKGVVWIAMNSSCEPTDENNPSRNNERTQRWNLDGPELCDPSGKVGKLYGASVTPQAVVIDSQGFVFYAGRVTNAGYLSTGRPRARNSIDEALTNIESVAPLKAMRRRIESTSQPTGP